jgi:hypothetical protein
MSFWTDAALEPKRGYRFIISITGMAGGAQFYAKKVKKPKISVESTEHKYINHTFKFPGGVTWDDVTVTLVDPVEPDAANNLTAILESAGYIIPGNENQVTTMSKLQSVASLGTVTIRQIDDARRTAGGAPLDITNGVVEEWILQNAWLKDIDFGEMAYDSKDLSEITMTIAYDWATLQTKNGSIVSGDLTGAGDLTAPVAGGLVDIGKLGPTRFKK